MIYEVFGTLYEHWLKIILKVEFSRYMYISDGNGDFEIGRFISQGCEFYFTYEISGKMAPMFVFPDLNLRNI